MIIEFNYGYWFLLFCTWAFTAGLGRLQASVQLLRTRVIAMLVSHGCLTHVCL